MLKKRQKTVIRRSDIHSFMGKALAKIIPFKKADSTEEKGDRTMFGLWKDHNDIDDVDAYVRNIRKGRQF